MIDQSAKHHLDQAAKHISAKHPDQHKVNQSIWQSISSAISGTFHFFSEPLRLYLRYLGFLDHLMVTTVLLIRRTATNLIIWLINGRLKALQRSIERQLARLAGRERRDYATLRRAMLLIAHILIADIRQSVGRERAARQRAVRRAEADTRTRVKWLHQAIEREAVAGWHAGQPARLGVLRELADLIATYNPETRALVGDLVKGILDLATIDDPLLRISLAFLMRHLINRLGIDRVIGDLLNRLLAAITGQPKPTGLTSVIADICARIAAQEQQWAAFYSHGGSEVEQAGQEWQELDSPLVAAGLLAFYGSAVAAPAQWAATVADTIGPVVDGALIAAADLIRKA